MGLPPRLNEIIPSPLGTERGAPARRQDRLPLLTPRSPAGTWPGKRPRSPPPEPSGARPVPAAPRKGLRAFPERGAAAEFLLLVRGCRRESRGFGEVGGGPQPSGREPEPLC